MAPNNNSNNNNNNNKEYSLLGSMLGSPYFGKLPHGCKSICLARLALKKKKKWPTVTGLGSRGGLGFRVNSGLCPTWKTPSSKRLWTRRVDRKTRRSGIDILPL